ncbi:hypothetical protein [uncultured Desulfosarcina sp.]|uniref:hypothetical protein n=1 Tax=uncultured Desulfosarcina sp. TaxID=218289 RepID=UPI0029C64844|nr:hypothetical protein [uncultured Desulfosarcina sp.]
MDLQAVKEEVKPVIPLKSGGSYALMWELFYTARLLKYTTPRHLKAVKPTFSKICSKKKLLALCDLGYLKNPQGEVFCATDKARDVLEEVGYNPKLLPGEPKGKGDVNELNNTEVFIDCLKHPYYKALLFPRFPIDKPYVIPDALLVLAKDNRYKLAFLEIESEKTNWQDHLENKRENYNRLACDKIVYSFWMSFAPLLDLPIPDRNMFCFSVWCIGDFRSDWPGWVFKNEI